MSIVLFDDKTMACAISERISSTITGKSNLYLLELDYIPEANEDYWISKYYHLDGDMKEIGRSKLRFGVVSTKWEGKLYLASDSKRYNFIIIVR